MIVTRGLGRGPVLGALVAFGLTTHSMVAPAEPRTVEGGPEVSHVHRTRPPSVILDPEEEEILAVITAFLNLT